MARSLSLSLHMARDLKLVVKAAYGNETRNYTALLPDERCRDAGKREDCGVVGDKVL